MHPASRGEAFSAGFVVGGILGLPIGLISGLALKDEQWTTILHPDRTTNESQNDGTYKSQINKTETFSAVTDIDGNTYKKVIIGTQVWMAENSKVSRYCNGDSIKNVADSFAWKTTTEGAWCYYDNDSTTGTIYGKLYNWYAIHDSRGLAPTGWHVATEEDWQILIDFLGGEAVAGGKLKEPGFDHWQTPNTGSTNESGFLALPGGSRSGEGRYVSLGQSAYFWSATDRDSEKAWFLTLQSESPAIRQELAPKNAVFSVRCVKD